MDERLTPSQRAEITAFQRLIEKQVVPCDGALPTHPIMLSDTNVKIYYWRKDRKYGKGTKEVNSALMSFFFNRKDVLRHLEL